jgi:hypothetical protein
MLKVTCKLVGSSPISFSKAIFEKKDPKEGHEQFEERTWKKRLHVDEKGNVFIPPMALKNCLSETAKYLGESIKGKGKSTYTKHFDAGVVVWDNLVLDGITEKDIEAEPIFVPSDGKKGGGSRVMKIFPTVRKWSADATIYIYDPIITPDKIKEYLSHAGMYIGLLRWRPRNGGLYGRFTVENLKAVEE